MGETVEEDRMETGVTQDDFDNALRRRVSPENGFDLFTDCVEHSCPYYPGKVRGVLFAVILVLAGCSSAPEASKAGPKASSEPTTIATSLTKHPLAKYLELGGFRMTESAQGKLKIVFTAINHSQADLGKLKVRIRLVGSAAKPEDPPVAEFESDIDGLGPMVSHDFTAEAPTKLRIYELPDWQFLRAQFEILQPTP